MTLCVETFCCAETDHFKPTKSHKLCVGNSSQERNRPNRQRSESRSTPPHSSITMLGWINDCAEKLIIAKYGLNAWHLVKQKAGCKVPDGGFFKLDHYADESTLDLVQAAAHVSGLTVPGIFEALGTFFVSYISDQGYESLLCCQGSTLRDFMTNINAIHQHLQTTFPKKMIMPEFWCEYNADDSSLTLHYCSRRGNHLAPLAVGLVREVAVRQFELDIVMNQTAIQGVGGSKFTR